MSCGDGVFVGNTVLYFYNIIDHICWKHQFGELEVWLSTCVIISSIYSKKLILLAQIGLYINITWCIDIAYTVNNCEILSKLII